MRHTTRTLLSVLLVVCCCANVIAEESGWRWPFGGKKEPAPASQASTAAPTFTPTPSPALPPSSAITPIGPQTAVPQYALPHYAPSANAPMNQNPSTAVQTDRPPIVESPFPKINWPTVQMPEWSLPKPHLPQLGPDRSQLDQTRNTWVEKSPNPAKPSPLQALSDGAHRVGDSTRAAWRKTVDTLTPGEADHRTGSRIAQRDVKPPFWKRMFGAEEAKPEGPQTIPQWMAQDRLDP